MPDISEPVQLSATSTELMHLKADTMLRTLVGRYKK